MEVIITAHMFYCSTERSIIAFSKDATGANLPRDTCSDWMHWKSITLAGDLEKKSGDLKVTDNKILKGLMEHDFFIAEERNIHTVHSLYQSGSTDSDSES
ncbi:hypothetical protein FNH22_24495 [Fulvivirga sp. M361]|uniref:hypothetical protein n=1 Tax=Fulvivirga sp. M361 TaxID=2594266 RepID=UPI001179FFD4|nr:hypothetical protein [Fulvivirga sp. M361]TRX51298.1 hypothetical protein FNH22_24495 [Fulvivirga sp. M361]